MSAWPVDFIIAAPFYSSRSGGIMVLHQLCTALNQLNFRASIVFITEGSQHSQNFKFAYSDNSAFYDPIGLFYDFTSDRSQGEIDRYVRNSFIIYPDIIKGNPLMGRGFSTYVLGRPAFPIDSMFTIAFSKLYIDKYDYLLCKSFISEWMHARDTMHWSHRKLSLTYIGKGQDYIECSIIPGTVLIERDWPRDKRQLAALLRNCKYFFSWDTVSATNTDAVMCGAVPVLMHDRQISRDKLRQAENGAFPVIEYFSGMQDQLPANQSEIDSAILDMQNRSASLMQDWKFRVEGFVEAVKTHLENVPLRDI